MIREHYDKNSGAILFKKDAESLRYEELLEKVRSQEKELSSYKKMFKKLESRIVDLEDAKKVE